MAFERLMQYEEASAILAEKTSRPLVLAPLSLALNLSEDAIFPTPDAGQREGARTSIMVAQCLIAG